MKRRTKRILIFSLSCMAAGALLTGAGWLAGGYPGFAYTRDGIVSASASAEPYTMEKTALDDLTSVEIRRPNPAVRRRAFLSGIRPGQRLRHTTL